MNTPTEEQQQYLDSMDAWLKCQSLCVESCKLSISKCERDIVLINEMLGCEHRQYEINQKRLDGGMRDVAEYKKINNLK